MVQDIHDGKDFAFFDPHGDEAENLLNFTSFPNTASRMLFISLHTTVSGR
jgi:hypothetical protein